MSWRSPGLGHWDRFDHIDFEAAARRLEGVVRRTPLQPIDSGDPRIELRAKLENLQETGAFKARGAWNQIAQLTDAERAAGVVTMSSGNHGKALSWAAQRAGVQATIVMPRDAYPNKIEACRALGAEVVLADSRSGCDLACDERVQAGAVLIHPYDAERTVQGAGTVGKEIDEDWPEVEVVVFPVGGGGLIAGSSLALRRSRSDAVRIVGAEPAGAPSMSLGLAAGKQVELEKIQTAVQGLCPPYSGKLNIEICARTLDRVEVLEDAVIFDAQKRLVQAGHVVEPAGAAAVAWVVSGGVPEEWLAGHSESHRLKVAAVVSGGNPDPEQLESIRNASA